MIEPNLADKTVLESPIVPIDNSSQKIVPVFPAATTRN
jgi:hypothetical protein